jgi:UDP:flavonoid glycosyltransferase YjiC (YdhE family)
VHDAYLALLSSESFSRSKQSFDDGAALPAYIQWLDSQPSGSVIYVNFGSIAALPIPQLHQLALGLEASHQRFLLVCRRPGSEVEGGQLQEECVLPALLPEGFKADREGGHGFVQQGWVSQIAVLSHPAVGAFLTHCGLNSTQESICRGLPLLAWPIQADQKLICRYIDFLLLPSQIYHHYIR